MQHVVKHEPSFSMLQVDLAPGDALVAEASAMVARSPGVQAAVRLGARRASGIGGRLRAVFIALLRKLVGGETFFVSHVSAPEGGWIWLAPALSGGIRHLSLSGEAMIFSAGAYLASAGDVDVRVRWGGLRAILTREGSFLIEASGVGDLWVTSYGAVEEIACEGSLLVNHGHLVGFDASLDLKLRSAGGAPMGFVVSGEGVVCELTGRGRVLIQTRNSGAILDWLAPLLPP